MQNSQKPKPQLDTPYKSDEPILQVADSTSIDQKISYVFEVLDEPLQVRVSRYYSSI